MINELRAIVRQLPDVVLEATGLDTWVHANAEGPTFAQGLSDTVAGIAERGRPVSGTGALGALDPAKAAGAVVTVGELAVNVNGSADMQAPEMKGAVREGALDAFNELLRTGLADYHAATGG